MSIRMCDGLFYIVELQDILKGSIVWLFKNKDSW